MELQVDASSQLASTCDSVWSGLACTCVVLQWLALTLSEIKFACKSTQVFHCLATQPKSMQVEWHPLTYYQPMKYRICLPWNGFFVTFVYLWRILRVFWATQHKSLCKFNLWLLASPFDQSLRRIILADLVWKVLDEMYKTADAELLQTYFGPH